MTLFVKLQCENFIYGTLSDQVLEDASVSQVAVDVGVPMPATDIDVVDRVERAGDGDGATVVGVIAAAGGKFIRKISV